MNSAVTLVDFDRMLNGLVHIYSEFSRACGLSDCAYWMCVDTGTAGGSIAVSRLTSEWFYSKQTINSAIKTLTARGFATLEFAERYVLPAQGAEQRAFETLEPWERREIMRLIGKFSQALGDECDAFKQHIATESQAENQGEGESCDS